MRPARVALSAVLLCATLAPIRAHGFARAGSDGGAAIEATGNLRLLAAFLHYLDRPPFPDDDALVAGVGRLILKGDLTPTIGYDLHAYFDLSRGLPTGTGGLGGAFATVGSFATPYRTPHLAWAFWSDGSVRGQLGLDRASVNARLGPVSLTAGRFPINDSVARVFTPNDFFAPFGAAAINRAYKPGVDAVRVGLSLGRLSGLEVTGVLGNDSDGNPAWSRSALYARANTVIAGLDAALVGGKLAERWIAGASVQGDIGPLNVHAEGHAGFADRPVPVADAAASREDPAKLHGRLSAGAGWRTTWHNLSLDAEYAWFSDGAAAPAAYLDRARRFFPDDFPMLGRHYLALSLAGEILPILRAAALAMLNAADGSGLAVLSLLYDISDESAFTAGLLIPWGRTPSLDPIALRSEFGIMPLTLFFETRFFF